MADQKNVNQDERYQYIGFEVFGAKSGEFWKDEGERKSFVEQVKSELGSVFRESVVYSSVLSKADRIFITLASVLMVIAPFLSWMSTRTLYGSVSYTGLFGLFNLGGFWFYVSKMDGWIVPLTIYLLAAMAVMSLGFGLLTLAAVYRKAASEEQYLLRLKKILRWHAIPFCTFALIVVLGLFGQRIPFGSSLGIQDLTGRYSVVTLVSFSSVGFWLAVFGFLLNFNKAKEL